MPIQGASPGSRCSKHQSLKVFVEALLPQEKISLGNKAVQLEGFLWALEGTSHRKLLPTTHRNFFAGSVYNFTVEAQYKGSSNSHPLIHPE
jgi:hypothetical protein